MAKGYVYERAGIQYIAIPDESFKGGYRIESTGQGSKRKAEQILKQKIEAIRDTLNGLVETDAQYLKHFEDFLKLYNGRTETYRSYKDVLRSFVKFLKEKYPRIQYLHEFVSHPKIFDDYRIWLKEKKRKDGTVRNHLKVLKTTFRQAEDWNTIPKAPKIDANIPIEDAKVIKTLEKERDFKAFFEACKKMKPEYYPHYFISARCGLRYGEMCSLTWDNVHFEEKYISITQTERFKPKGRRKRTGRPKERSVPLTKDAIDVLRSIPKNPKYKNVFLRDGRPIDPHNKRDNKNFRYWIKQIAKAAGIEGITRMHELRHTAAKLVYNASRDLYVVMEFLGHSDIRTTERYAGKPTKQVEEAVKKLDGFGTK